MNKQEITKLDSEYICPTYGRFDVCITGGKGCYAFADDGKKYLDFTSGIGVNSLGFCNDEWTNAVCKQASTLNHTSNLFYTQPSTILAQKLCRRTSMSKVFFANSGAEANEGAIKAARKFSHMHTNENRSTIISLVNSFHGRTMATITATGQEAFHQHFGPFLPGFKHVPANNIEAFKTALTPDVCAIMVEIIQGEGGVVPLEAAYLTQLQALCKKNNVLIIADEVQTGIGRTGKFLASEHFSFKPDIVTLAKGLGGGLPIGAFLLADSCADALSKGDHGTTFGANPICCAGANVILDSLTADFLDSVAEKGDFLKTELQTLPEVESVTGMGLMLGITFKEPIKAADVLQLAIKNGLLCLTAKEKLRLLPPLNITKEELVIGLEILKASLAQLC